MAEQDWQTRTLAYFTARHCSPQWHDFVSVLVEELFGSVGEEDAKAFMHHLGANLARRHPLPELDTVEALEAGINTCWHSMDWGWCRLRAGENGVRIIHGAWPMVVASDDRWPQALAMVLEGAYSTWLRAQGGGNVPVRRMRMEVGQPMEFIYGA